MKKILVVLMAGVFLTTLLPLVSTGHIQSKCTDASLLSCGKTMNILYETGFEQGNDWESGSFGGPDLWHQTSVDSWTGDYSLGCFDSSPKCYHNDMDFNYVLSPMPMFSLEGAIDMTMDFYFTFITEDSDDHWGIVLYDPGTDNFLAHVWTASESWQQLPYETYGYHSMWMGPMQPIGEYESFSIKQAYDQWYNLGFFRDSNGHRIYDFQVGFVFYESDESGVINAEAEACGKYWSGLFIDDVSIKQLTFNSPPDNPVISYGPTEGSTGVFYDYSAVAADNDDDMIRYGWDWNADTLVDEWTDYYSSGSTVTSSHKWNTVGTYQVKVKAMDEHGAESEFSVGKTVLITENNPPSKPVISGPSSGKVGTSNTYISTSTDAEEDNVYYWFDWGDDSNTGWVGPFSSGATASQSHIWNTKGTFSVKVKAKDIYGVESAWSDSITVAMPKSKNSWIRQVLSAPTLLKRCSFLKESFFSDVKSFDGKTSMQLQESNCIGLMNGWWEYDENSKRWCIDFPAIFFYSSLVWSTEIKDAYVAYFSYDTTYDFGTHACGYVEISADGGNTWYVLDKLTDSGGPITREFDISYWAGFDILIRMRALSGKNDVFSSGNWCVWNLSIYGMRDKTPPVSTVTLNGDLEESGWYSSSVQIVIAANDPEGVGIDEIHYVFDNEHFVVEDNIARFTVDSNGDHLLEYWAVDVAENEETHHSVSFKIDTISPSLSIVEPTDGVYLFGNKIFDAQQIIIVGSFSISVDAEDTGGSGLYRLQFFLDDLLFAEDTEIPFTVTCAESHIGTATIKVVAEDNAGNMQNQLMPLIYFKL